MNTTTDRPDDATPGTPSSDDLLAAEYALGVLDAAERRAVQARLSADTGFARLVDDWEERLSPWTLRADATTPSPHVWPRIRSRLGWASVEPARPRLWDNAAFWRGVAGLAAAAGIAAVVIGLNRAPVSPPVAQEAAAQPVTVLAREGGATGWIARIDAARGKVLMMPVPAPADPGGLVHELWIIPAGGAPQSLGFVSGDKAHTIDVPPALRSAMVAGATLAVSLEEPAGIPHAAPSARIVAHGGIQAI
ncbi:MAG TPA: anti-sigma factor [Tahibacter sp.]|nr:anti-sigma factor [Tahibacter sp.]